MNSLGHHLSKLVALNKPFSDARRDAARQKRKQQLAVERFYEDAKDHIQWAIQSGVQPEPLVLGTSSSRGGAEEAATAMETFRWKHNQRVVPPNNPFRPEWDKFVAWAQAQKLEVYFTDDHDGVGVHSWKCLCVRPDQRLVGPAPDVAEEAVCVPKDVLARFGSAQAYLDHLQRLAGAA